MSGSTERLFDLDTIDSAANYVKFLGVDRDGVNVAAKTKIAEVKFKVSDAAQEGSVITFRATASVDGSAAEVVVGTVTVAKSIVDIYDENNNGRIDDNELITAIMDWLNGKISDSELIELIMSWLS